jgi:hypothetical protein
MDNKWSIFILNDLCYCLTPWELLRCEQIRKTRFGHFTLENHIQGEKERRRGLDLVLLIPCDSF